MPLLSSRRGPLSHLTSIIAHLIIDLKKDYGNTLQKSCFCGQDHEPDYLLKPILSDRLGPAKRKLHCDPIGDSCDFVISQWVLDFINIEITWDRH